MLKIENLYHGTNKKFNEFNDEFLGHASGTGYIKGHWFAHKGRNPEKAAFQYAKKLGQDNYVYLVSIHVKKESVVSSVDLINNKLNESQIEFLKKKELKLNKNMTFQELISDNESTIRDFLIGFDILVICNWQPDNGLCEEYISVLTTKNSFCNVKIDPNLNPKCNF